MVEPIKVLVIDDHKSVTDAFMQIATFPRNRDIKIAHTVETEEDALETLRTQSFDVAVVDMRLAGDNEAGLRIIEATAGQAHAPKMLAISAAVETPEFIVRTIRSGAAGYILKRAAHWDEIFEAIRKVHRGEKVFPPEVIQIVVEGEPTWLRLTGREQEVWQLIADGLTNREIAQRLSISLDAVKRCTSELYGKIGVSNRAQATRKWLEEQYGLIEVKSS